MCAIRLSTGLFENWSEKAKKSLANFLVGKIGLGNATTEGIGADTGINVLRGGSINAK